MPQDYGATVPRTRGDEPAAGWWVWGISLLFPARAGMNRLTPGGLAGVGTVPRTRGDEPGLTLDMNASSDCSPHARG